MSIRDEMYIADLKEQIEEDEFMIDWLCAALELETSVASERWLDSADKAYMERGK